MGARLPTDCGACWAPRSCGSSWIETATGGPLPAERWREYCLSSVTTHDLPPTAGYLAGDHVRLRESLGLLTRPVETELASDRAELAAWMAELRRVGLLDDPGAEVDPEQVILALYRYLGRTPSRLLGVALTDAVGDRRTQNQPGTTDEYPNWRVPLTGPDGRAGDARGRVHRSPGRQPGRGRARSDRPSDRLIR